MRSAGERGFALAVSIFALVIIAALITGVFFAARQEMKIGEASVTAQRAFSAADAGINNAIFKWELPDWNVLAVNQTDTFSGTLPSGTGSWSGTVKRLNTELYFIQVTGTDKTNSATRTLGALSRLLIMQIQMRGAITTQGQLTLSGNCTVTGVDATPAGWSCPTVHDTLPAVATANASQVTVKGSTTIIGPIQQDTTITSQTFQRFGDLTWDQLVAMATKVYPAGYTSSDFAPVVTGGSCDLSIMDNWGDPLNPTGPCGGYFPIIYVNGALNANNGYGQGILIVNGDLNIQGRFRFYGATIVKGTIKVAGSGTMGSHFSGGIMAANINLQNDQVMGDATVEYSSCTLAKAMQANSPGRWIRQRSWVDLF